MRHNAFAGEVSRADLVGWYHRARARTRELFSLITEDAYYDRPIRLRNPIVFYEGHLPAFAVNTLVKLTHGRRGIDAEFETLFARGIDPDSEDAAKTPTDVWPSRADVQAYGRAAEALVEETLNEPSEAAFTILEHELMHHETLLYLFHQLPYEKKRAGTRAAEAGGRERPPLHRTVSVPAGRATLGNDRDFFGWDNEFPAHTVDVDAFSVDAHNVTNGAYLEYVEATGAPAPHFWKREGDRWLWRGMFAAVPLPLDAPVYATHDEATAYTRWKNARLMSEAEYHRALGSGANEGNYDFQHWDPVPAGSYAPNDYGIYDLVGNGWEWTSSEFAPFDGFRPMPSYLQYSADFFDHAHYVLKGASPATARELVRPSLRNWFRPSYPFVYATFRCVRD
jgi:iron(II)-dependent oxidoreductase